MKIKYFIVCMSNAIISMLASDMVYTLGEVTTREWKDAGGASIQLVRLQRLNTPQATLVLAYYGVQSNETVCVDFYDQGGIGETNATLRLLCHDFEQARLIDLVIKTNKSESLFTIVRHRRSSLGKTIRVQYGYRLDLKRNILRTTEEFQAEMEGR